MDADPQCNMTEMLLCDVIEQLDEEAECTGVVAELPGTSLLQVLEPRFNGDVSLMKGLIPQLCWGEWSKRERVRY